MLKDSHVVQWTMLLQVEILPTSNIDLPWVSPSSPLTLCRKWQNKCAGHRSVVLIFTLFACFCMFRMCVCWTCDYQDALSFWMFCHTMSTEYLLQCGHPCYVEWVFFGTWIVCHTHYKQNHKSLLWILVSSITLILLRRVFVLDWL